MTSKHYTSSVFILTDGHPAKVLLVHHRKLAKWLEPGGHQEVNEDPVEAAIREVKEETGLDITNYLAPKEELDDHTWNLAAPKYVLEERMADHYHLDMIYVVKLPEVAVRHRAKESVDIGWFTVDQLDDLDTFDNVRILLRKELVL